MSVQRQPRYSKFDRDLEVNPLAERIVVVRLDDRSCVTVDDGADTAEVLM